MQAAFSSNLVPIDGGGGGGEAEIEGRAIERGKQPRITFTGVTPHFRQTLSVPILRGRDFTDAEGWSTHAGRDHQSDHGDQSAGPMAIRSSGGSGCARADGSSEWFRVIGVVPDMQLFGIDPGNSQPLASAFVPYAYQETLEHRRHDPRRRRPCVDRVRRAGRDSRGGSEHSDRVGSGRWRICGA